MNEQGVSDFLGLTSPDYNVLGATAQIPIILTGAIVSLLNLDMSYLVLFLVCFQFISIFEHYYLICPLNI